MSLTGRRLGPYEISAKLGEGGMGEIWRARDTRLGREVAIKLLPESLSEKAANLARFEQEARAASSLNHPNIVTVHDVGTADGRPYIVMEMVEGRTLRKILSRARPPSLEWTLDLAAQVAEAMAVAHAAGIVHRDLKPDNLMVTADGRVKILDFGLAKLVAPEARELAAGPDDTTLDPSRESGQAPPGHWSRPGAMVGTVGYMAPEQVRGAPLDFRADQFAFGAILYEMVTGNSAFERSSRIDTLAAILDEDPKSVAILAPEVPLPLRWVIERCLAKKPADRYASTVDLARELRNLSEHLDETSSSGTSGSGVRSARAGAWSRRWRWIAGLGLAAAVAIAAGGLVWRTLGGASPLPRSKQLAVLGFRNAGGDAMEQAFCDGLFETLTTRLTQLERFEGSFWVVPASEIRRSGVDSADAAHRTFGATLVITGSVQRIGDLLRLNANLVDATSLRQLRAISFDARAGDVAALQDDLVRRVSDMLDLEVGPEARRVLDAGRTGIAGAYDAYLRGRGHLLDYQNAEAVDAAIGDFQDALQRDPGYALAYAGLGEAYWRQYALTHEVAVVDLARRACEKAVELNDLLAPVHVTLGLLEAGSGRPEKALENFRTALRLDPGSAVARRELGNALAALGRRDEAERTFREAIGLRPGDWASYNDLGVFYYRTGRYAEAAEQFVRVVGIAPDNVRGYSNLGGIYQLEGRYEEARDALGRAVAIQPTSTALSNLGTLEFFLHDYAEAARTFERAQEVAGEHDYRLWQNLAGAYYWAPGQRNRAPAAYLRAVELAQEGLSVNPRDPLLLADLAECEAMLGRGAMARERVAAALEISPEDPDILFRAASVYERLGERELALARIGDALRAGYSRREIEAIPDFAALREDPRFERLSVAPRATQDS